MKSVVQEGNFVLLPVELAQEYGLHEGSEVDWVRADSGTWTLQPTLSRAEIARSLLGAGAKYVKPGESGVENFLIERHRDDEQ